MKTVQILAIGDELVMGERLDTNSRWIASRCVELGLRPLGVRMVDDHRDALADAFRDSRNADVVIATGGLGPTVDDLTRQALADASGRTLVEDARALDEIRAFFERRGSAMRPGNAVQAQVPKGAEAITNEHGTAPGIALELDDRQVFCLPGPPREMKPMFESFVAPRIKGTTLMRTRLVPVVGVPESEIAQRLDDLMTRTRDPVVGTTASGAIVTCRVRARDASDDDLDQTVEIVRERLAPHVLEADTLEASVLSLLEGATVSTAESCTGGMIASRLTNVPGSSASVRGGWVTYTNEMKSSQLGVPPDLFERDGAVSAPCVRAMASGARKASESTWSVSVSGIAGPGGGSTAKPVGTVWIGIAGPDVLEARRFLVAGTREDVRTRSTVAALACLRLHLIGRADATLLWEQAREP